MSAALAVVLLVVGVLSFVAVIAAGVMAHCLPADEEAKAWRMTVKARERATEMMKEKRDE